MGIANASLFDYDEPRHGEGGPINGLFSIMNSQAMASGGRIVRVITRRLAKGGAVDQWFIVGIDDDLNAMKAVCKSASADVGVEIMGVLTPAITAQWKLRQGEIKPAAPGEPA